MSLDHLDLVFYKTTVHANRHWNSKAALFTVLCGANTVWLYSNKASFCDRCLWIRRGPPMNAIQGQALSFSHIQAWSQTLWLTILSNRVWEVQFHTPSPRRPTLSQYRMRYRPWCVSWCGTVGRLGKEEGGWFRPLKAENFFQLMTEREAGGNPIRRRID